MNLTSFVVVVVVVVVCVCACVRACVRACVSACVRACVCVCVNNWWKIERKRHAVTMLLYYNNDVQ